MQYSANRMWRVIVRHIWSNADAVAPVCSLSHFMLDMYWMAGKLRKKLDTLPLINQRLVS